MLICKYCPKRKVIKKQGRTTSNQVRHVKKFHPQKLKEFIEIEEKNPASEKITDHFATSDVYARNSSKKKALNEAFAMFLAEDMRPIALSEVRICIVSLLFLHSGPSGRGQAFVDIELRVQL